MWKRSFYKTFIENIYINFFNLFIVEDQSLRKKNKNK